MLRRPMRLLLTRAVDDAARTREKLEAMGHQVMVSPVIEIVSTEASWPIGVVDAVVATSAHAFIKLPNGLSSEARRLLPLFLVGERTEAAARVAGFVGGPTVAKTAAALAQEFRELAARPRRLVYLAGRDRKPDLEAAFADMGQAVDVVEVYGAHPCATPSQEAVRALQGNAVDGVLHFSRRSASLFVEVTKKAGLDMGRPTHFCLSEDVAAPLRDAGYPAIEVALEPHEADLLALVGTV